MKRKAFTLAEVLIALGIVAVIAVLILPVITTRAQNKSFAMSYETEVKQMLNSLEGLPLNEGKEDITGTMMSVEKAPTGDDYSSSAGKYIKKYMKVAKDCDNAPGGCFGDKYYEYKDNDRQEFDISDIKGACALLRNGVSICLKPQIRGEGGNDAITGWIDLNGPKAPNVYGRDLRTFAINLKQRAVYTEEEPTQVIIPDQPAPCDTEACKADPCKNNPQSEDCCQKRENNGSIKTADDECCPLYYNKKGAIHDLCYPTRKPSGCEDHKITGPNDKCCGDDPEKYPDGACCKRNETSSFCCKVNPETEACCSYRIAHGYKLTAGDACCKYSSIKSANKICQPTCQQDENSEECCNTSDRRNSIKDPEDQCCRFNAINGKGSGDKGGENSKFHKYCCRLSVDGSEQCCKWKVAHMTGNPATVSNSTFNYNDSDTDTYYNHKIDSSIDVFDKCCQSSTYGIRTSYGNIKNEKILQRCCSVPKIKSDGYNNQEKTNCCKYLVKAKGRAELLPNGSLRKCCDREDFKHEPECCSNTRDGVFEYDPDYSKQCCMPSTAVSEQFNKNNIKPHVNCCFEFSSTAEGSSGNWYGARDDQSTGCCSFTEYNGKNTNTIARWQRNCCYLRSRYASASSFNSNCCTDKSSNRYKWSPKNEDCCHSLIEVSKNAPQSTYWQEHCCHGYKGGNLSTGDKKYYETEKECCQLNNNWTAGCCTKAGFDNKDEKWKKNCCSHYNAYGDNATYRKYCCSGDYVRIGDNGVDNPNGLNNENARKNVKAELQHCCDPEIVGENNGYSMDGDRYVFDKTKGPHIECCKYFQSKGWMQEDGKTPVSKYYKAACCQLYHVYDEDKFSCEEKWMCGEYTQYGITGKYEPTCCIDSYTEMKKDITKPNVWRPGCCDFPSHYSSNATYRANCCSTDSDQTKSGGEKSGSDMYTDNVTGQSTKYSLYCCDPTSLYPTKECCKYFKNNGDGHDKWKSRDGADMTVDSSSAYMLACCEQSTNSTGDDLCPDSCSIRWKTSERKAQINYNFKECCQSMAPTYNQKDVWRNNCCKYAPIKLKDIKGNAQGYASYSDYRKGCCSTTKDGTFKDSNDGTNQSVQNCCIPNSVTAYDAVNHRVTSGIMPSEECCRLFMRGNALLEGGKRKNKDDWKGFDGELINTAYKVACCDKYGVCPDSCKIRSMTNNPERYKLPDCCADDEMQSKHKGDASWQKQCCDSTYDDSTKKDLHKSSLNTLSDNEFRQYCCNSAGSSSITKMGKNDIRCCSSTNTHLRSNYCCANIPTDLSTSTKNTAITAYCTCADASKYWNVVNTSYTSDCCADSSVLSDVTKGTPIRQDWQNKCCSVFHTVPVNPWRNYHYDYCCNNGGPYADKSDWLGSTCCLKTPSSAASADNEGADWKKNQETACCSYDAKYPNEFCCKTRSAAQYWSSSRNSVDASDAYRKACCSMNKDYCTCGMIYEGYTDTNISIGDLSMSCCVQLSFNKRDTELKWQNACCNASISRYPSKAAYRASCCSNVDKGTNKSGNKHPSKYCCSPDSQNPSVGCCEEFKKNKWKDWDGNDISTAYKVACCKKSDSEHDLCESCDIRAQVDDIELWNLPECCDNELMYQLHHDTPEWLTGYQDESGQVHPGCCQSLSGDMYAGNGAYTNAARKKWSSRWVEAGCCDVLKSENDMHSTEPDDTQAYGELCCPSIPKSDWRNSYCCYSPNGVGNVDSDNNGLNYIQDNDTNCCSYKADAANKFCCDAKGQSENWKSNDTSDTSDEFRDSCCKDVSEGYCGCIGSFAHYSKITSASCCSDPNLSTYLFNNIGNFNKLRTWRDVCCSDPSIVNPTNNLNLVLNSVFCCQRKEIWLGTSCCKVTTAVEATYANNGLSATGGQVKSCCYYDGTPNPFCCKEAQKAGWPNENFHNHCCSDVGKEFCDSCKLKYKNTNDALDADCCKELSSEFSNETSWRDRCCKNSPNDPSKIGLSDSQFKSVCCIPAEGQYSDGGQGDVYGTSTKNMNLCCTNFWFLNPEYTDLSGHHDFAASACCSASGDGSLATDPSSKNANCCDPTAQFPDVSEYCCGAGVYDTSDAGTVEECEALQCKEPKGDCCYVMTSQRNSSTWKNNCCPLGVGAAKGKSGLNKDEYKKYCCANAYGKLYSTGTEKFNYELCCSSYSYGTACCHDEGHEINKDSSGNYKVKYDCCNFNTNKPNKLCCSNTSSRSRMRKTAQDYCCSEYGYCGDDTPCEYYLNSDLDKFKANAGKCCPQLSVKYKDNTNWRSTCCPLGISADGSSLQDNTSGLSESDYKGTCCQSSEGDVWGSDTKNYDLCCSSYYYNSSSSYSACCGAAGDGKDVKGNVNTSCCWIDSETPSKDCCSDETTYNKLSQKGKDYCCSAHSICNNCSSKLKNNLTEFKKAKTECCPQTVSEANTNINWKNICCPLGKSTAYSWQTQNNSGLSDSTDPAYADVCCEDPTTGDIMGGGTDWGMCCTDFNHQSDGSVSNCCNYSGNGSTKAGGYDERCCSYKTNSSYCCTQAKNANYDNDHGGLAFKTLCGAETCVDKLKNNEELDSSCCAETSSYANNSDYGSQWQKYCCTHGATYINDSNFSQYCCNSSQQAKTDSVWDYRCCGKYGTSGDFTVTSATAACCNQAFQNKDKTPAACCSQVDYTNSLYRDVWKNKCCGKASHGDVTMKRSSDFANYCCTGDGKGSVVSNEDSENNDWANTNAACCSYTVRSDYCCQHAEDNNFDSSHGGLTFKKACGNNICSDLYNAITNPDSASSWTEFDKENCCSSTTSSRNEDKWKKHCCPKKNSSGLTGTAYAATCCENRNKSGKIYGTNADNWGICCTEYDKDPSTGDLSACCDASGNGTTKTGVDNVKCCSYKVKSDVCCNEANSSNFNDQHGGYDFKKLCGDNSCTDSLSNNDWTEFDNKSCCSSMASSLPTSDDLLKKYKEHCCPKGEGRTNSGKSGDDYSNMCCESRDRSGKILGTDTENWGACCTYDATKTIAINKNCCEAAASDWASHGGDDFHNACCKKYPSNDKLGCTCDIWYNNASTWTTELANGGCCASLASSKGSQKEQKWQSGCCTSDTYKADEKTYGCCTYRLSHKDDINNPTPWGLTGGINGSDDLDKEPCCQNKDFVGESTNSNDKLDRTSENFLKGCCNKSTSNVRGDTSIANCCKMIYDASADAENEKNGSVSIFYPGSDCCDAMKAAGMVSATQYSACYDPCKDDQTYSSSDYRLINNETAYNCCTTGNAKGTSSDFSTSEVLGDDIYSKYCCYVTKPDGQSWAVNDDPETCCPKRKGSDDIYWYNPTKWVDGHACQGDTGEPYVCSKYYDRNKGWTCGLECDLNSTDSSTGTGSLGCCNMWYNSQDDLTQDQLDTVKKGCCDISSFNSSHQDWCNPCQAGSDNYYSASCCEQRYPGNTLYYNADWSNGGVPDSQDKEYRESKYFLYKGNEDACECCSRNPSSKNSTFCETFCCPSSPTPSKVSSACCDKWQKAGVLKGSSVADDCCNETHNGNYCCVHISPPKACSADWKVWVIPGAGDKNIYATVNYDGPGSNTRGAAWIRIEYNYQVLCQSNAVCYASGSGYPVSNGGAPQVLGSYTCNGSTAVCSASPTLSCRVYGTDTHAGIGLAGSSTLISNSCNDKYSTSSYGNCGKSYAYWTYKNGSTCGEGGSTGSTESTCGVQPTQSKISENCCKEWYDIDALSSGSIGNSCCDYSGFRSYCNGCCKKITRTTGAECSWNISTSVYLPESEMNAGYDNKQIYYTIYNTGRPTTGGGGGSEPCTAVVSSPVNLHYVKGGGAGGSINNCPDAKSINTGKVSATGTCGRYCDSCVGLGGMPTITTGTTVCRIYRNGIVISNECRGTYPPNATSATTETYWSYNKGDFEGGF